MNYKKIPVGISSRHLHLSENDLSILFGSNYKLNPIKNLSQTGQYASAEEVKLVTFKDSIDKIRILGPVRSDTQIELSITDSFKLGIKAPIRESGNITDTPGLIIVGPKGFVKLEKGVIIAARHIHMSPKDADDFKVKNSQIVSVKTEGMRSIIFNNVVIRVREDFVLDFHIDTDEANSAALSNGDLVEII
jgi:putative phosphotransacetylase